MKVTLGAIQRGAEERFEVLRDKKRKLETGEVEMKPVLGHIEFEEEEEGSKTEKRKPDDIGEGEIPRKRRTTQLVGCTKRGKEAREHRKTRKTLARIDRTKKRVRSQCECRCTHKNKGYFNRDVCEQFNRNLNQ